MSPRDGFAYARGSDSGRNSRPGVAEATQNDAAVMFVDICDSTRLYESMGDVHAYDLNARFLEFLVDCAARHGGAIIRTEGDGALCTFPSADAAWDAALEMQSHEYDGRLTIKIGLNFGPTIPGVGGDIYGDAVNLAARMLSLAKPDEVLLTGEIASRLASNQQRELHPISTVAVKGKAEAVAVYSVLRHKDKTTVYAPVGSASETRKVLSLVYHASETRLGPELTRFVIGRASECDLVIPGNRSSRHHAIIEVKRGRYLLTDQSTNGTFVVSNHHEVLFLRRDAAPLLGKGTIYVGSAPENADEYVEEVHFEHITDVGPKDTGPGR